MARNAAGLQYKYLVCVQSAIHLSATAVALEQQSPSLLPGSTESLTSAASNLTTQVSVDNRRTFSVLRVTQDELPLCR